MNKNTVILEIFDFLKQRGIVDTEGEFSEGWLGQCDSYYRGLRFKRTEPSIGVVAIVGSRLQKAGEQIVESPRHAHVGQRFLELSEKCHELVNENAVVLELV
jgi:UDP-N-acetylenolpyruvoylglucosamine reductase